MPVFWIIINLVNFWYFLVICLVKIELNLDRKTRFAFI